jgi:hypothetical protein
MTSTKPKREAHLYRIADFDRAADIITSRKLYFSHPSEWDDPYEKILHHDRAKAIFAQCWSRKGVSDAMWRIYSPHSLGVRIGTTKQLLQSALEEEKRRRKLDFKIQNVDYKYQEELDFELAGARDRLASNYSFKNAAAPLFLKRKAFDHERETRVVVFDPAAMSEEKAKGITIDIDPFRVVTSIWIDPRAPDAVVSAFKYYLKEKLGFPGTVKKSGLYLAPNQLGIQAESES